VWKAQQIRCASDVSISPVMCAYLSSIATIYDISILVEPWRQCSFSLYQRDILKVEFFGIIK